ncbi:MAG TPA: STAS domain-containing protein [Chthoniobacterales bacterium]|jgi:anti-sigma B factor antagonist|nr:STAS domain-containing protein [Chthoniobacterales bacterium]
MIPPTVLQTRARFDSADVDPVFFRYSAVQSSILVGVNGPAVWVRVEGKGNFLNSGSLKEFAQEMINRGYREFIVDLENCAMMDSTFMGTLAAVALRLKGIGQGHLHVVHCGQRSRDLLSGLGLDQIFDIRSNGAVAPECQEVKENAVDGADTRKKETSETMLEAHQALCEAAPENLARFKDVLEYLKQDLHQTTAGK